MASTINPYQVYQEHSFAELRFTFISTGKRDVAKTVQYTYVQRFDDRDVYNLGFGDFNFENYLIEDCVITNNGDVNKVFSTVLATIPLFFLKFYDAILMVQGSDGRPEFGDLCRKTCTKNCHLSCKKLNQRITIYRQFVEKNFVDLSRNYWFLGGFKKCGEVISAERFIMGRPYELILMFRK